MSGAVRLVTARTVALTLLLACVGALLGFLLAQRNSPTYQASLQMRVTSDPVVGVEDPSADDEDAQDFLSTELLVLNGEEVGGDVERAADPADRLATTSTQLGTSNIVQVLATARDREVAVDGAQAVARDYTDLRQKALRSQVTSVRAEVDRQLVDVSRQIAGVREGEGITGEIQRNALTAEYARLVQLKNTLQLATDASRRLVQVVRPATAGGVEQIVHPGRDAALGGLVGGVVGLSAALLLARRRRRVDGLDDLFDLAPELALPTLPPLRGRRLADQAAAALSPHLSALTSPQGTFGSPPLVVAAPHPGAGATLTAVGLAVASARRRPTLLLAAGDALDGGAARLLGIDLDADDSRAHTEGLPTAYENLTYLALVKGSGPEALAALEARVASGVLVEPGTTLAAVIDAPALSESSAALDLARLGGQVLLVGGVEHSRAADLQAASVALRRVGGRLVGVVLSSPPVTLLRRRRR